MRVEFLLSEEKKLLELFQKYGFVGWDWDTHKESAFQLFIEVTSRYFI